MVENRVGSKKRGNRGMRAIVHMHDDSRAAMKAFSEKRAAMAIGVKRHFLITSGDAVASN